MTLSTSNPASPTLLPCVKLVSLVPEPIHVASIALCEQNLTWQEQRLLRAIVSAKNFVLQGDVFATSLLKTCAVARRDKVATVAMLTIAHGINSLVLCPS
jgi:hypothetical protein